MSYIVPGEMPQHCNRCPFGHLYYALPLTSKEKIIHPAIDGQAICGGEHGYVCNLDFLENGKYTKVARADCHEDIQKPKWCPLVELEAVNEK